MEELIGLEDDIAEIDDDFQIVVSGCGWTGEKD